MDASANNGVDAGGGEGAVVRVKKYPNRRFYDATHSRHVTLRELHDLIVGGREIQVTDSTTGEDITRAVLTQIILEQDPPKLEFFPTSILHQVIRTQRQMLGDVTASFFQQWLATQQASQQRWMEWMRSAFTSGQQVVPPNPLDPMDWAARFWGTAAEREGGAGAVREEGSRPSAGATGERAAGELEALREEMAALQKRLDGLSKGTARG
ncbi:MAG: polyhydroxyalkanoate synthesis regulator DNA-binding domain-containing protein [Phycisphaerae bacterium]|nr:polyhydroxyalkanoate synthesis regulator DNA-binding domain-containing protein [Phycisphaerae bacterium]